MMKLKLFYKLMLHDKKGKLVKDTGFLPSHSFVLQFLQAIEGLFDAIDMTAKDVDNTDQLIIEAVLDIDTQMNCNAGVGVDTYGIVVGTNDGETAEDNTNVNLDTKILHSATGEAGKMNYRAVTFVAPTEIGVNIDFDMSRPFINETASTITVKEIGIIARTDTKYFLLLRDVVSDFAVTAGYTLTVVYTLRTTA